MTPQVPPGRRRESGAILVHVAVALLALVTFSALTIDYGIMWMSRRQAQNAADAAALAGAISMAYDAPDNYDQARLAAKTFGEASKIFGQSPNITQGTGSSGLITQDISFPECPPGAPGIPDTCVRVNVYRNDFKDALPTFFAKLAGLTEQGTKATATAQILTGNASDCVKPWAIPDKWEEHWENGVAWDPSPGEWTKDSIFDKYMKSGNDMVPDPSVTDPDVYVAPTEDDPGTGFQPWDAETHEPTEDYGRELALKIGASEDRISSGWFLALNMPGCPNPSNGADCYRWNIKNCNSTQYAIGDSIPVDSKQGNMIGPTSQGVEGGGKTPEDEALGLIQQDPDAQWDPCKTTTSGGACVGGVVDSCAAPGLCPSGPDGAMQFESLSPRIVPVPLFNVDAFFDGSPSGKETITITNMAGFFIDRIEDKNIIGYMMPFNGTVKGTSTVTPESSYLLQVILVR